MTIEAKLNALKIPNDLIPTDPRFGSGPSVIPKSHLETLVQECPHLIGTSHRKSAVIDLFKEVHHGLSTYFQVPKNYEIIMVL
jgi:phosphoserine aminotransferase